VNPAGYVYRTAFRLLRSRLPEFALSDQDRPAPDVSDEATTNVTVAAAFAAMPVRRRACALLCFVAGLTPAEAGETLGIEASTVRKHLEAARKDLAVSLRS
jgi:DNA-directed RNA polymerase specialized sigma24 family protein